MQTMRIGGFVSPAGAKRSSNGRARETPAARRKWRRVCMSIPLLSSERFALHDLVHQRAEAVVPVADFPHNRVDVFLVSRRRTGAGGVDQEFLGQGAGELVLVGQQQLLEF